MEVSSHLNDSYFLRPGKTSVVKALSTLLSTAALDKSKQSRQRGMTLDLGFSCFFMDVPENLQPHFPTKKRLQITLVDCPGHASLIRTIIGGAQIIDMVLLVVDAVKGWQAQTTECLVLAEMTSPHLLVALNKADMFNPAEREKEIEKSKQSIRQRLIGTRFANSPIVGVAACVGGEKVAAETDGVSSAATSASNETYQMDVLMKMIKENLPRPRRHQVNSTQEQPFYFSIDHCFPIRGRGTVMTGTVLSGVIAVNDMIEFPALGLERKVKSMQMFKRQVPAIQHGDRAGICVSNLDAKLLERGIAAAPGAVPLWKGAIALVQKVKYYTAGNLQGGAKFHISVGHSTVMGTVSFWGAQELAEQASNTQQQSSKLDTNGKLINSSLGGDADMAGLPHLSFDFNQDFVQQDSVVEKLNSGEVNDNGKPPLHWALINFQTPVYCPSDSLIIGSRLDTAVDHATGSAATCRLAFSGRLIDRVDPDEAASKLRLYTTKEKTGKIAKLGDPHRRADDGKTIRYEVFGSDLFKAETNMKLFIGMKLETPGGDVGEIKSSYGTVGMFRVYFPGGTDAKEGDELILRFRRYANDPDKRMVQAVKLPAARTGARLEPEQKPKKAKKKVDKGVCRHGVVVSLKGDVLENGKHSMAIISGFFAPEINIKERAGIAVLIPGTTEQGTIVGPFGKAGKCKVAFKEGISAQGGDKAELQI